jgi:hypothetical protein
MIENPVVMELPAASRPSRTMLFWNVAVPCPSITNPQIWFAVRVEVTLSEWTRFCSTKFPSDGSVKSIP